VSTPIRSPRAPAPAYLRALRVITAALATAAAVIYLRLAVAALPAAGAGVSDPGLLWFGLVAAAAYLFGTVVIVMSDRWLWWLGGAFVQVVAVFAYAGLPADRAALPASWGTTLRVVQALILLALAVLIARYPQRAGLARPGVGPRRRGDRDR